MKKTNKKNVKPLTVDQQLKLLFTTCKTKKELKNWIKYHLGLEIPDCTVSRYATTNPLDAIWKIYDICVNRNNPDNIEELLYVASRGAGKCVAKDTLILTKSGLISIQDVVVGDEVFTGTKWAPVKQVFDEGILNGVNLVTKSGKSLIGSYDRHRILVLNKDNENVEWKYLRDISIGDNVYISNVAGLGDVPMDDRNFNDRDLRELGHIEEVQDIEVVEAYFYDIEVDDPSHAYWSNGFISHNTLGVAIAELLVMLHDQRDVVHVGAILSQAKRCYEYQVSFMLNDKLKPLLSMKLRGTPILEKMNMEKSTFNLIDRYSKTPKKTTLEVLPCTLKAVNGPHVSVCCIDELDTVSGEALKAFNDISGMLDSRPNRKALRVGISTRKSRYGLMNKQIEDAEAAGRTVEWWTALEFSERCPDERSGKHKTIGYVLQDEMEVITEEEWQRKSKQKKEEYFKQEFYGEGCLKCPIAALCLSDAKKQQSTSSMLKPIGDPIKKAMEAGPDWAISQLFNLKPSIEGVVYKEFDEKKHVKSWNEMWEILTGKPFPGECTHDIFVKQCKSQKLAAYGAIDFGWSNPSTLVVAYIDNRENVYVVRCEGQTYTNNPTWIQTIKNKWHHLYRIQMYFPDLANPGDGVTMRQEGLPCPNTQTKDTQGGIQVLKKWLKSLASPVPKIFFARETCGPIIDEFQKYHYKLDAAGNITDDPAKEYDHWLDALRYMMYELFSTSKFVMVNDDVAANTPLVDSQGNFSRQPSVEEFAAAKSIDLNTDVDTSKLGQIGTLSELEEDEDDGSSSGSGGFLWSF